MSNRLIRTRNPYPKEWTAGSRGQSEYSERWEKPLSKVNATTTAHWSSDSHNLTAAEFLAERVKRLKESKRPFKVDGMTATFVENDGTTVELAYEDYPDNQPEEPGEQSHD